jgi:prepilin-type N-terminal cleavage/methylation domain-containing protein
MTREACHNARPGVRGFTMVEMLVTITIIGILAAATLGVVAAAQESARKAKTRATIAKLDNIISRLYESYRTRRVPIDTSGLDPQMAADMRLKALRHLMRMEMPERPSDIELPNVAPAHGPYQGATGADIPVVIYGWVQPPNGGTPIESDPSITNPLDPNFEKYIRYMSRPSLSRSYYYRWHNTPPDNQNPYLPAELLYMIVTTAGGPDARKQFGDSEVGDADHDGWPEFLDAWGNPIYFLRWAPGFPDSDIQPVVSYVPTGTSAYVMNTPEALELMKAAMAQDHDPFDLRKADKPKLPEASFPINDTNKPRGWRLWPLIYSAGPDGIYDINREPGYSYFDPAAYQTTFTGAGRESPYFFNLSNNHCGDDWNESGMPFDSDVNTSVTHPLSAPNGALDHYDNIHNHHIESR